MDEIYHVNVWAGGERPFSHQVDKRTFGRVANAIYNRVDGVRNGYDIKIKPGPSAIFFHTVDKELVYLNLKNCPMVSCRKGFTGADPLSSEDLKGLGVPRKRKK